MQNRRKADTGVRRLPFFVTGEELKRAGGDLRFLWILSLGLVISMMVVIFRFSAADAIHSSGLSEGISYEIIRRICGLFPEKVSKAKMMNLAGLIETPVRKGAHFTEYAMLSVCVNYYLWNCFLLKTGHTGKRGKEQKNCFRKWQGFLLWAEAFCVFYACTDEFHQHFVPGRSCRFFDVCVDSAGALAGGLVFWLIMGRKRRKTITFSCLDDFLQKGYNEEKNKRCSNHGKGEMDMKCSQLLKDLEYTCLQGSVDTVVKAVVNDSRKITEGCLFLCIRGASFDGHKFAKDAAEEGAAVLIVEEPVEVSEDVTVIQVEDTRYAMALISAAWFGYPARELTTIAVTGTKGKTTTTYMIKALLEEAGHKVGVIGTIEVVIGDKHIPVNNTTPESYDIHSYFRQMAEEDCDVVVMEASSQGFKLDRTAGIEFDYGLFTNLSPDHIGPNEHKDFEEYLSCKAKLFSQSRYGFANLDDEHFTEITKHATCPIETFGLDPKADLVASDVELTRDRDFLGVDFTLSGTYEGRISCGVPGTFNVHNALGAICVAGHMGVTVEQMNKALRHFTVKGRVQIIPTGYDYTLIVDYAHNAVALESILKTLRAYNPPRLISLFGCGGNRSKLRRYEMGEVSGKMADFTIITSDNPRFEEPQAIIDDILVGMKKTDGKYTTIIDRHEAISYAMHHANPGDIVVLAGKGHETYQEIKGKKYHMSEEEIVQDVLDGKY